ncbi:DNA-processing protein DprA [Nocardioides sp.]|uniref:DNA-processing protein DprA n=1 Tax=Nocardioides sp. TaxID=35761 RepID=UPI00272023C1|nr:DNA-processing protein DprA [Nocardioides sp.]MDO9458003.1 DNA-processing protein DprA [Nocardioides sp.]
MSVVTHEERLARVALNRLGEPGETKMTGLVAELGPVRLRQLLLAESDLDGLSEEVAARRDDLDAERELERAERQGLRFVVPGDAEWPTQLGDLLGAGALNDRGGVPIGLWVKGPLRLDALATSLAVVGARAATTYGDEVASEIAATAAQAGHVVVSGGAFGIDRAAHRGAVAAGAPTVAVVACGADRVYPSAHAVMFEHIARTGAIVSEAPPGAAPLKIRFLARNRLIAALSVGTVVVEAAIRSGSLNTAHWAGILNRPVMGVPGPVTSAASGGVHEHLRAGDMSLVTCGADVLELVSPAGEHLVEPAWDEATLRDRLTPRQRQVIDAVPVVSPAGSDSIARTAGLGVREVQGALTALQTVGLVEINRGGWRLTALART